MPDPDLDWDTEQHGSMADYATDDNTVEMED